MRYALLLLLLVACTAPRAVAPSVPSDTPEPSVVADDVRLINALYASHNAAWESGPEAGCDAVIASAYPPMRAASDYRLTRDACLESLRKVGATSAYREVEMPELASVERADGWTIPVGSLKGRGVEGRVYVLTLRTRVSGSATPAQEFTDTVHVVILGGKAYDFTTYAQ